ncbi:helix-turn-helix transcriptional regulator [Actinomadura sp. DC4]|uniref:helix-turn-helix domain-containing protein n=1 Tax=Actinomadura sp. DC4 TaxID=3055069 RepID=UPI0025B1D74B|nr:helix-turn-helix transcriptional regulator [Actinomadura sp. DC4]MDN3355055.1 helix-turn-helix transcriptional regulator [Actinomadura sp. DC4]
MPWTSPTLRRRELSARLKELREKAKVDVATAAEALGCSTDKIHWIERAEWNRPRWRDVRDLLDRYGVTDERLRNYLIQLARDSGQQDWWHPYKAMLSEEYTTYIAYEGEAEELLMFELSIIPGLLQTEEYTRALTGAGPAELDADEIEQRVKIRGERRRVLERPDPVRLFAVIDEAALRRPVGGPEVMRAQLQHLVQMAAHPKVTLQVLPFAAGPHPGTGGRFTILRFPGPPGAVYIETIAGELFIQSGGVDQYQSVFRRLNAKALSPEATIEMLDEMMRS